LIIGIGTDLVEIARIEKALARPGFVERILTPAERAYCTTAERVAGRWAAKEAIAKVLGTHLTWHQVEVLRGDQGQPVVRFATTVQEANQWKVHLSISHTDTHALAMVVVELCS